MLDASCYTCGEAIWLDTHTGEMTTAGAIVDGVCVVCGSGDLDHRKMPDVVQLLQDCLDFLEERQLNCYYEGSVTEDEHNLRGTVVKGLAECHTLK